MSRKQLFVIFIISVMLPMRVVAIGVKLENWEEFKKDYKSISEVHIGGVGYGYSWANTALGGRGDTPFYCVPEKLVLNNRHYIEIIDREILRTEEPYSPDYPIELILLLGLINTFPC